MTVFAENFPFFAVAASEALAQKFFLLSFSLEMVHFVTYKQGGGGGGGENSSAAAAAVAYINEGEPRKG